jgi:hypothetical protein
MGFGQQIIDAMKAKGYRVRALNIVGLEGVNRDFTLNSDEFDLFNDLLVVVSDKGDVRLALECTTEPGAYYTDNPMNQDGAARLQFGQYRGAYQVGQHHNQYPALVQVGEVSVCRDGNADGTRTGDIVDTGYFGINIHTTADYASDYAPHFVDRWSAGCQVVQRSDAFYGQFMPLVQSFGNDLFDYTLLDGSEIFE